MRNELMNEIEGAVAMIKSGAYNSSAGANLLASLESRVDAEGLDKETLADIKDSLDTVARRIRQLMKAERVLHQKISNAAPQDPSGGPVVFIGT